MKAQAHRKQPADERRGKSRSEYIPEFCTQTAREYAAAEAPVIVQEYRETVWTAAAGEAVLDEAAGVSRLRRKVVTR